MQENKDMMTADEVAVMLRIGRNKAYKIIHELNTELNSKGYITISGRIPTHYLRERLNLPNPNDARK